MERPFESSLLRTIGVLVSAALLMFVISSPRAHADQIPAGWEASNMKPVGYTAMDGRGGAFKMAIRKINGRWYLYTGHLWHRGWSIVDVTDPANPEYVKFVPWPQDNTWTIQMELHDNLMVTALQRAQANGWGGDSSKPFDEGVVLWDISDPVNPKQISHWKTGSTGVHRLGYPGGMYVNLAANMPGFRGQILVFLDVSDPKNPKEAGRWWEYGQKEDEPAPPGPISFHGPAIIDGNTAYLGYSNEVAILDISDIAHPKTISELKMGPPFGGGIPVHDVMFIPDRKLLYAHSESTTGDNANVAPCSGPLFLSGLVDVKDPAKPRLISLFPLPVPLAGESYKDFCDKGGRFGPHNTNLEYHLPDVEKPGNLIYATYFNAGLRVFNIENPRVPTEAGWFVPPTPTKRQGPIPINTLVNQTEDVLVDTRGNIYITDKQWGVFVLRYTGKGQPRATAAD
jgi:hypothetical protein